MDRCRSACDLADRGADRPPAIVRRPALVLCLVPVCAWSIPAAGQGASGEFWPEVGIYIQQGPAIRIEFVDSASSNPVTHDWLGNFTFYVETALKPVFRRQLIDRADVYRNRYLTFRGGYRYRTSLTPGGSVSENRGIVDVTSRYLLPWHLVVSDRNRGEFRFVKGQTFSTRYRNRLQVERDFKFGSFVCTPFVYDEIFYDSRYDQWTPNRYAFGVQLPVGPHVVLEPYYLRQDGNRSNPPHVNVFGFMFNLYF
jgi:Protein of unknown function (DUF2490)